MGKAVRWGGIDSLNTRTLAVLRARLWLARCPAARAPPRVAVLSNSLLKQDVLGQARRSPLLSRDVTPADLAGAAAVHGAFTPSSGWMHSHLWPGGSTWTGQRWPIVVLCGLSVLLGFPSLHGASVSVCYTHSPIRGS